MRKQIITALLTISVSVAIIAGCGTKKPLQTETNYDHNWHGVLYRMDWRLCK